MEDVACNLCGSRQAKPAYRMPDILYHPDESFEVVECENCGLGYVNPRPAREEIGRYYPSMFYDYFDAAFHRQRYMREARYLDNLGGAGRKLLDVGCANGDFPRFMQQRGWAVSGVEVSDAAREITDFPVFRGQFSDIPAPVEQFDVVTAWAVLEHVHDPRAYFAKAAEVLRPGGFFVFLVTNFESWSSRHLYREDLPRHLYFFNEDTVRRYLSESGFELVRTVLDDSIYALRPVNWLRYCVYRYLLRRDLRWEDLPERPAAYFERIGRSDLVARIRYVLRHPFAVLDRSLLPLFELAMPRRLTRGIAVHVARKR